MLAATTGESGQGRNRLTWLPDERLIFARQHQREQPVGLGWVFRGLCATRHPVIGVGVNLPKHSLTGEFEAPEIMFAIRIVVLAERRERAHLRPGVGKERRRLGGHTGCHHTPAWHLRLTEDRETAGRAERVVQRRDPLGCPAHAATPDS